MEPLYSDLKLHVLCCLSRLSAGANALLQDADGETALHKAAAQGHAAVVSALIAAEPQACMFLDKRGLTPQSSAVGAAVTVAWPS